MYSHVYLHVHTYLPANYVYIHIPLAIVHVHVASIKSVVMFILYFTADTHTILNVTHMSCMNRIKTNVVYLFACE